jgi:hypothetical protein
MTFGGSTPVALFDATGRPLSLGERIADSGEATLYRDAADEARIIKLHHVPREATRRKLAVIPALAPDDPSLGGFHRNFAWPLSAVWNGAEEAVGVVLPAVPGARSLTALGNPKLRARRAADMNFHFLHAVAANVAFLLARLHAAGIVVGDLKPDNILIDDRALATLIDCDSVQVAEPDGTVHPCPVGSEGFTPPEWIGRSFADAPRHETADRFGLAVILYQLLTGAHPWTGEWMGPGDPPHRDKLIQAGDWPFRPGARLRPVPGMVPPDALNPGLAGLFRRAFIAGLSDPEARPESDEWHEALCTALAELEPCAARPHHHHDASLSECPWCARVAAGLPDPFPNPATPPDPFAPLVLAFERALSRGDTRMAVELWRENPVLGRRDDLARLRPRMTDLGAAIDALDTWTAARAAAPGDAHALAALLDDLPVLNRADLFRHEEIDGETVARALARVTDAALTIPAPPKQTSPDATPRSVPVEPPRPGKARPPRVPLGERLVIGYGIQAGWHGLRPARLTVTPHGTGRVPALVLRAVEDGRVVASLPAGPARGRVDVTFDQPAERVTLDLVTASPDDRGLVTIKPPPKRHRTLGGGGLLSPVATTA